jgi:hypothetical protein
MAELFEQIARRTDTARLTRALWMRRALLAVFLAVAALALANVFGQAPRTTSAAAPAASVTVSAPETLRGGLLFQSRIEVRARDAVDQPRLVLGDGWVEGMQISSIEPEPESEGSQDGHVRLAYGQLRAGDELVVWVQSEVDPTNPGRRDYGLTLQDGDAPIAHIDRSLTVLP